jgi:23S rRNA pseudouridine2605 synthase
VKKDKKNIINSIDEKIRLNKYISHNTKYSRREADRLIEEGRVNIGNKTVTNMGEMVTYQDKIFIDRKFIKPKDESQFTVIVYNKPKGELVTKKDDRDRKTIYHSLSSNYSHFIPIGRLDYASEGVLLLTDSPKVAQVLMESDLERVYNLKISGTISKDIQTAMDDGLELDDATDGAFKNTKITSMSFAPFSWYKVIKNTLIFSKIKVSIKEGQNRELRRFFGHFKRDVKDLKRVAYGWIELNALPTGKNRYLSKDEYNRLHRFLAEEKKKKTITN